MSDCYLNNDVKRFAIDFCSENIDLRQILVILGDFGVDFGVWRGVISGRFSPIFWVFLDFFGEKLRRDQKLGEAKGPFFSLKGFLGTFGTNLRVF